jgi:hypothetical protein
LARSIPRRRRKMKIKITKRVKSKRKSKIKTHSAGFSSPTGAGRKSYS